jgi:hypothetical protein
MGGSDARPKTDSHAEAGSEPDCPSRLTTVISGPAAGITKGSWLQVRVDRSGGGPRVILVDEVTNTTVGSLAGVPNLAVLIRCLDEGVPYRALVDHVDGGRIDVTVIQG